MIEKMKTVRVITASSRKEDMLQALRDLGIVHIAEKKSAQAVYLDRVSILQNTSMELREYETEEKVPEILTDDVFRELLRTVRHTLDNRRSLSAARNAAAMEAERLKEWGDFEPREVRELAEKGIEMHFYRMGKKEFRQLLKDENVQVIRLAPVDKMETVAVIGKLDPSFPANEFLLPPKSLSTCLQEVEEYDEELASCEHVLSDAAKYTRSFDAQLLKAQNEEEYSAVGETAEDQDGLVMLDGYIPAANEDMFREAAARNNWAWVIDDPAQDDEHVPTKIKYNKVTRLIIPVFDILGTVPAYREYDISTWFLGFFTLFFAMIIGDAGYGCLFLIAAVVMTLKKKQLSNAVLLLYVLSIATIVWGALTGTWFGIEGAMRVPFLKSLVLPSIANYPEYFGVTTTAQQNTVMKFCFSIGVVHLALACVMNIKRKIGEKNLNWVADLGWLLAICALYFVVLFMVIGENVNMTVAAVVVGVGFILAVLFGGMAPGLRFGKGLKAGVSNAFTVFLDTISAFGNIMSYIRLFAVGLASLAIAQSFNDMASGFHGAGIIAGVLIVLIGHGLNIIMGLLSVVVHGVRLNLLEFSGQLGMEWTGTAYDPFQKRDKIKK